MTATASPANVPVGVPHLKLHDIRTVSRDAVTDWMILVGDKCYGGYTRRIVTQRSLASAPPYTFVDPLESQEK
ncbi:MAG: DUF2314 domain-containing protein [Planctomycetaceae bacterium]